MMKQETSETSAADVIVPIDLYNQPGSAWTNEMSDQLVNALVGKGFDRDYIRVCRFLSVVHVHFRLSGNVEEAKAEAIEAVEAAIEGSGKPVWQPHVEVKLVLPESQPAFCV